MKKSMCLFILVLSMLSMQAQDYLISFSGAGDTAVIATVKVDNLTSGASATLNGGDMLHLVAVSGIGPLSIDHGSLQIHPNPMEGQSTLDFATPEAGNSVISIVDLSGRVVCRISKKLSRGMHNFRISGMYNGTYIVKVAGRNYDFSAKLVSQCSQSGEAKIEYVSTDGNITNGNLKSNAATVDLQYTDGDQLLYTGISGKYSTLVPDVPTGSKAVIFNFVSCTDSDGNNYPTVRIGSTKSGFQTWMGKDLNVGIRIDKNQTQANNSIIEKYCFHDSAEYCTIYGGLYVWDEAMQFVTTQGTQGICPAGWHIPTNTEWSTLTESIGGEAVAGGNMKETGYVHWMSPNAGATNSSGFTALPAGYRNFDGTFFLNIWQDSYWWSSNEYDATNATHWYASFITSYNGWANFSKNFGLSVRCLKNQ